MTSSTRPLAMVQGASPTRGTGWADEALHRLVSFALRSELADTGVTVTCLTPGATDTEFFERAGMLDTKIGQAKKDDPAMVARRGGRRHGVEEQAADHARERDSQHRARGAAPALGGTGLPAGGGG
jgi:NAD(P)-dependent dehydrogenase (short-subunit alcohol dehydrogenase family)